MRACCTAADGPCRPGTAGSARSPTPIATDAPSFILERTTAEWIDLFEQLYIPATPIHSLCDLPEHPHLKAVGLFQETHHPTEGPLREIRPPMRFSATPLSLRRHAPSLGEHTHEVLLEAGFTREEMTRVVATTATAVD